MEVVSLAAKIMIKWFMLCTKGMMNLLEKISRKKD